MGVSLQVGTTGARAASACTASLTTTMRQSSAIATNMDRRFSTCSSCLLRVVRMSPSSLIPRASSLRTIFGSLETLVSPSTMRRTSVPKRRWMSSKVSAVSSTVSCKRPETTLSTSKRLSARMDATLTG